MFRLFFNAIFLLVTILYSSSQCRWFLIISKSLWDVWSVTLLLPMVWLAVISKYIYSFVETDLGFLWHFCILNCLGNNNNPIPPAELLQAIRQLLSHEVVDLLSVCSLTCDSLYTNSCYLLIKKSISYVTSLVQILREMDSVNGRDPSARRWREGRLVVESGRVSETFGRLLLALGRANSGTSRRATLVCTSH